MGTLRYATSGALLGLGIGLVGPACESPSGFACGSDQECANGEIEGQCEANGFCSFPAGDCLSGQRYGSHSGPQSGQCVDLPGTTGGPAPLGGSTTEVPPPDTDPELDTGSDPDSTSLGLTGGETTGVLPSDTSEGSSTGETVDPDLVLWLEFEDSADPTIPDSSPLMSDGVCDSSVCPVTGPGAIGQGAVFDGVDDLITVPHGPHFETFDGLTVATWLWIDLPPTTHWALVTKPVGIDIQNSWELYFFTSVAAEAFLRFNMHSEGVGHIAVAPTLIPTETWVHVAATWDGALSTLWIDGEPVADVMSPTIDIDDHPIHIGADKDQGELLGYLLGALDDVRIYRRALTEDEIAAIIAAR